MFQGKLVVTSSRLSEGTMEKCYSCLEKKKDVKRRYYSSGFCTVVYFMCNACFKKDNEKGKRYPDDRRKGKVCKECG
jgi:hypothetical protein